jgi:hypothetical protein
LLDCKRHFSFAYLQGINTGMKKTNKQLIETLKEALNSEEEIKRERIKMLVSNGFFALSEDEKNLLLNPTEKKTRRRKSNAEEKKDI